MTVWSPVIFGYFYDFLYATSKNVSGLPATADRPYLSQVSITQS
jgi:hypothetical protein